MLNKIPVLNYQQERNNKYHDLQSDSKFAEAILLDHGNLAI